MSIYVDGSSALKIERNWQAEAAERSEEEKRRLERKKARLAAQQRKVAREKRLIRTAMASIGAVLLLSVLIVMLSAVIRTSELTNEIDVLEAQLLELSAQNDSKEFEINTSVDMNQVIQIATEQLGMVRSTTDQIISYTAKDTEYFQQVAEIPGN